jgi:hypothetical protein
MGGIKHRQARGHRKKEVTGDSCRIVRIVGLGLIINFHEMKLTDGLVRMILPGANCADE